MNSFTVQPPPFALNITKGADKVSFEIWSGKQKVIVQILPDEEGAVATGSANTKDHLEYNYTPYESMNNKITKLPVFTFTLTLKTTYKDQVNPLSRSGYGRGTTKEDIKSKHISLGFHESQHGLQIMNYIKTYPPPLPQMHLHMHETELTRLLSLYDSKFQTYLATLGRQNKAKVDCVGVLPQKGYDAELDGICWPTKPRKRSR